MRSIAASARDRRYTVSVEYPEFPRAAVGAVVFRSTDRGLEVLLVRRGRAPAVGVWALPGGSIELGESLEQAVEREVYEETGVSVRARFVVHAFDSVERDVARRIMYHYVIVDLLAEYLEGEPVAGDDADDARWWLVSELSAASAVPPPATACDGVSDQTLQLVKKLAREWRAE